MVGVKTGFWTCMPSIRALIRSSSAVEQPAVNRLVGGSNPSSGANRPQKPRVSAAFLFSYPPARPCVVLHERLPPLLPPTGRIIGTDAMIWRWLLAEVTSTANAVAAERGLAFIARPCLATVRSDASKLGRILRNLVENALRDTKAGTVEIRCQAIGATLRIEMRDTGIGIAPGQVAHIWDEFHQIDNEARDREKGLGLGLAWPSSVGLPICWGIRSV